MRSGKGRKWGTERGGGRPGVRRVVGGGREGSVRESGRMVSGAPVRGALRRWVGWGQDGNGGGGQLHVQVWGVTADDSQFQIMIRGVTSVQFFFIME